MLSAESLDTVLAGMSTSPIDPTGEYGLGVAVLKDSPLVRGVGHDGWIPGFVSSLRFFPSQGAAVAFWFNTGIGIIGEDRPVVLDIENRLAELVFGADQIR